MSNRTMTVLYDTATEEVFLGHPGNDRNALGTLLFLPNKFPFNNRDIRLNDQGRTLDCQSPLTFSVPAGLPVGFFCFIAQTAAGAVQVRPKPGSAVTVNGQSGAVFHAAPSPWSSQPSSFFGTAATYGGPIVLQATAQDVYTLSVAGPGGLVAA